MKTIAYDVIDVNLFLLTLKRFLLKKEAQNIPTILLVITIRALAAAAAAKKQAD